MNTTELITFLQKFPGTLPVYSANDGFFCPIEREPRVGKLYKPDGFLNGKKIPVPPDINSLSSDERQSVSDALLLG